MKVYYLIWIIAVWKAADILRTVEAGNETDDSITGFFQTYTFTKLIYSKVCRYQERHHHYNQQAYNYKVQPQMYNVLYQSKYQPIQQNYYYQEPEAEETTTCADVVIMPGQCQNTKTFHYLTYLYPTQQCFTYEAANCTGDGYFNDYRAHGFPNFNKFKAVRVPAGQQDSSYGYSIRESFLSFICFS